VACSDDRAPNRAGHSRGTHRRDVIVITPYKGCKPRFSARAPIDCAEGVTPAAAKK